MKIVFMSIGSYPYVSDFGYQDNELAKVAVQQGDDVIELSTTYIPGFLKDYIHETSDFLKNDFIDQYGVRIIRLQYKHNFFGKRINLRLRSYKGLYDVLEQEKPDLIFLHDLQVWSLFDIAKYLRRHTDCYGIADLHATYKNGCRNFLSKYLQHRVFYKFIIRRNIDAFKKIYYLTNDALFFFETEYGIKLPKEKLGFLPIGGQLALPEEHAPVRAKILKLLNLSEDSVLVLHSGKMVKEKKTTDLIRAVTETDDPRLQLIIIGKLDKEYAEEVRPLIDNCDRVHFLGWKSSDELREYMIGCDLYAQPGTESASANNAICCGCPIMLSPEDQNCGGYRSYLESDKVFFIKNESDMKTVFNKILKDPKILERYRVYSRSYACNLLDYQKQIKMIKNMKND